MRLETSGKRGAILSEAKNVDELFLIVVAGEFNAGKSALINALLGQCVLTEGVTPTTTLITLVKHGDKTEESYGGRRNRRARFSARPAARAEFR